MGAGDAERARSLAEQAVQRARSSGRRHFEVLAILSFARVVIGSSGAAERDEAGRQRHLGVAHGLFAEMGASGHAERVGREIAVA